MTDWRVGVAVAPEIIWARYADAIGLDDLKVTFGDHWPPPAVRPGETVFVWRDASLSPRPFDAKDHPAAWLSLTVDQFDSADIHMSRGVWPDQHGKNLGRLMRSYAEQWARDRGAATLTIEVAAANALHLANVLADDYWVPSGVTYNPVAFEFTHELAEGG